MLNNITNVNKNKRNKICLIGKVYKYEFINLSRSIFPLFFTLLLLGLVSGIFMPKVQFRNEESVKQNIEKYDNGQIDFQILRNCVVREFVVDGEVIENDESLSINEKCSIIILIVNCLILFLATITAVVIIVKIDSRLKKAFYEDEAYFTFTLPLTMGEHITGRFLCYFTFALLWAISIFISLQLGFIKYLDGISYNLIRITINESYIKTGLFPSLPMMILQVALSFIVLFSLFISFLFLEKTICMKFFKHKTLISGLIEIPLIILWIVMTVKAPQYFSRSTFFVLFLIINIALVAVNITITYITYKKSINIE